MKQILLSDSTATALSVWLHASKMRGSDVLHNYALRNDLAHTNGNAIATEVLAVVDAAEPWERTTAAEIRTNDLEQTLNLAEAMLCKLAKYALDLGRTKQLGEIRETLRRIHLIQGG